MSDRTEVAVIGGGAAGLAAAIFACGGRRVVVLDGAPRLGAKILVSGGGRCNVTHDHVTADDFFAARPFVRHVLAAFDERDAVEWFASMGVRLKTEDTGKLFPTTDSARTVLEALLRRCGELGVEILTSHRVREVRRNTHGFEVLHSRGVLAAERVVLATGGRSLPKTGSDGEGWRIAQSLGHTVTPTHAALVPLTLSPHFFHESLSGLSCVVELTTVARGKRIDRRTGSLLWTHFGVSGPVVMDASRCWVIAQAQGTGPVLRCSFAPGLEFAQVERVLIDAASATPKRSCVTVVSDLATGRLAEALLVYSGIEPTLPMGQLPRELRRKLVHTLTALELPVEDFRGWNYAEVTAGGVPLKEVDHRTMESKLVPGLHLVGEVLDCDGRIGGFNFQWAWSTGFVAGMAMRRTPGAAR